MLRKHAPRALRLGRGPIPQGNAQGSQPGALPNAIVACGWGRFIAAHTFTDPGEVASALLAERSG